HDLIDKEINKKEHHENTRTRNQEKSRRFRWVKYLITLKKPTKLKRHYAANTENCMDLRCTACRTKNSTSDRRHNRARAGCIKARWPAVVLNERILPLHRRLNLKSSDDERDRHTAQSRSPKRYPL